MDAGYVDAQSKTITAWGRIKISTPMMNLLAGVPDGTSLVLESAKKSVRYRAAVNSGSDSIVNAFRTGKFEFTNVPAEGQSMNFTLCYTSAAGQQNCYRSVFAFTYPKQTIQNSVRFKDAVKIAGYMGDYTIDITSGKITRTEGKP
jgi:hypothetical protein